MERLLRIKSHAGIGRYLASVTHCGYILRHAEIPSPFAYSPTHLVYQDAKRGKVIVVETAHKQYDVFRVAEISWSQERDALKEVYRLKAKEGR